MMQRGMSDTWDEAKARYEYEQRELAVYQASTPEELHAAYSALAGQDVSHSVNVRTMYEQSSPATLITALLRGYELPQAGMRLASNVALLRTAQDFERLKVHDRLSEQFWLMLAQQRDVLLSHIEEDLEAMLARSDEMGDEERTLMSLHMVIRNKTGQAVEALFGADVQVQEA